MKSQLKYAVWVFLLLMQFAFLLYSKNNSNAFLKDSIEYINQAENILNHGTCYCGNLNDPIIPQLYSQRPPFYGFFLLLIRLISNSTLIVTVIQSLLSLVNIYIAWQLSKKFSNKTMRPMFFLVPFLFFPSQFIYSNMLMSEIVLQTTVMLAVFFLLRFFETAKMNTLIFYQLFITAALLTKPVFFAFPIISIFFFLLIKDKKNTTPAMVSHLIPFAAIMLVSFSNYAHTGYFEYSSIQRKLMINYNARYAAAFNEGDENALHQLDSIENYASGLSTYSEKASCIQSGANRMIAVNLDAYVLLTLKGIITFFIDHSRYDMETFSGKSPPEDMDGWKSKFKKEGLSGTTSYLSRFNVFFFIYLLLSMFVNLMLFAGLIRFAILKNVALYCRVTLLSFIFYVALLTGITGTTRFRLPVFLLIVIANMIVISRSNFSFKKSSATSE